MKRAVKTLSIASVHVGMSFGRYINPIVIRKGQILPTIYRPDHISLSKLKLLKQKSRNLVSPYILRQKKGLSKEPFEREERDKQEMVSRTNGL